MAGHLHVHLACLPLFFLLMTTSLSISTSWGRNRDHDDDDDDDFRRWISWNVENYKMKRTTTAGIRLEGRFYVREGGVGGLDMKLAEAERAAVKYIVSQDGNGHYKSIREALESIPTPNRRRVNLEIRSGIYREKIVIPKTQPFISFLGDPASPPVITGNDTASVEHNGSALETFHSATVAVNSDYFIAANIKFENTAPGPDVGQIGGQAVALRISGNKSAFYHCSFYGEQDTLYDHKGLHYFNNCFIQGSMDFIFGYGRSFYENCNLNSVAKKVAALTAQKRNMATMESGFSFVGGTITGSGLVYLGRAWGDHSRVIFSYMFMDKVVIPAGWDGWRIQRPEESVYYGEYNCIGPGANWTGRVHWARPLTFIEAQPFLKTDYIYGNSWLLGPPSI